jgi:acetylornithine deacetylase/succinyl-diaminopimelate desuccinylase-like protein
MKPMRGEPAELVLARTWRPALSVIGAEGLPEPSAAGNVLRPKTSLVLSMRLPPTVKAERAAKALKGALEARPPYGASVKFDAHQSASGWNAPKTAPWLEKALEAASRRHFGKSVMWMGEGGTIPFMAMLGAKFPRAQFFLTGVLGPHSNAHGPNEFLHIEYAKKLTACVADVIAAQAEPPAR